MDLDFFKKVKDEYKDKDKDFEMEIPENIERVCYYSPKHIVFPTKIYCQSAEMTVEIRKDPKDWEFLCGVANRKSTRNSNIYYSPSTNEIVVRCFIGYIEYSSYSILIYSTVGWEDDGRVVVYLSRTKRREFRSILDKYLRNVMAGRDIYCMFSWPSLGFELEPEKMKRVVERRAKETFHIF